MAGALAVVLVGKPLVALVIVWAMAYPFKVALTVAIALAQIGEFSFILATLGRELGHPDGRRRPTRWSRRRSCRSSLNPLLYRTIEPVERVGRGAPGALRPCSNRDRRLRSESRAGGAARMARSALTAPSSIGYGPTGRTVVRLLRENDIAPTVIELNIDTVRALREDGVDAVYGDATRPETLEAAGVGEAGSLILGSAGMAHSAEVIRAARG